MTAVRLRVGPADDAAELARGAEGAESVLLVLDPGLEPLAIARALASLGPLAVELAPDTRVNALRLGADAELDDVEAAARFLEAARSTTGQVLEISCRV